MTIIDPGVMQGQSLECELAELNSWIQATAHYPVLPVKRQPQESTSPGMVPKAAMCGLPMRGVGGVEKSEGAPPSDPLVEVGGLLQLQEGLLAEHNRLRPRACSTTSWTADTSAISASTTAGNKYSAQGLMEGRGQSLRGGSVHLVKLSGRTSVGV